MAAGYATRLYPLTENQPKPLLKVAGKPIVEHIIEKMRGVEELDEIFIVTNHRFYDHFRIWLNHYEYSKKITIVDDGTLTNDDRLGAVGDINFVLKEKEIDDDVLVIAGDNLFGFSLKKFVDKFNEKSASIVAFCDLGDIEKVRNKFGVGILDGERLVNFEEKPNEPSSSLAATACYLFKRADLASIETAIEQGYADNSGDLVKWLVRKSFVSAFVFDEHWFDIGSFESLKHAEEVYSK